MKIHVNSQEKALNSSFKKYIEKRLRRFYRKASDSVSRITVTLKDINGPKGGTDKQCKLKLTMSGQPPILVVATKETSEKAFFHAAARAAQTLSRQLKRRKRQSRSVIALKRQYA